jgi:hypothetical protein
VTPARTVLSCDNFDWYEAGRNDGSSGLAATAFQDRLTRCKGGNAQMYQLLYTNGREAGLTLYCTPTMGYEMGKASQAYENACPEHLEKKFLSGYEIGKRVRSLESENIDLEQRIETILRLLPSSQSVGNVNLRSQLENLQTRRASNSSEISNLESSVDQSINQSPNQPPSQKTRQ